MKVTVRFGNVRVVVPCGDGAFPVRELVHQALLRYKKATSRVADRFTVTHLSTLDGGILDPDDRLCEVADDREQIVAQFDLSRSSSPGPLPSPDQINEDLEEDVRPTTPTAPVLTRVSASPRTFYELLNIGHEDLESAEIQEVVVKNETGPLGLHLSPRCDLLGNDRGLRVEGIDPDSVIARDGRIELDDTIVRLNGHDLVNICFEEAQKVVVQCLKEPYLKLSVLKQRRGDDKPKVDMEKAVEVLDEGDRLIDISLTKGPTGLGFSVATRFSPAGGQNRIYVKNVLPRGAAVEDGRLRPGDRIVEVNGSSIEQKSQPEVVALLKSVPVGAKVALRLLREKGAGYQVARSVDVHDSVKGAMSSGSNESDPSNSGTYDECCFQASGSEGYGSPYETSTMICHMDRNLCTTSTILNGVNFNLGSFTRGIGEGEVGVEKSVEVELFDGERMLKMTSTNSWYPVIDRLKEYNRTAYDERYMTETSDTWREVTCRQEGDYERLLPLENKGFNDEEHQYYNDPIYASLSSYEETNAPGDQFSRDAPGRKSMSEKKHARLNAKYTDTYKKNRKQREEGPKNPRKLKKNGSSSEEGSLFFEDKSEVDSDYATMDRPSQASLQNQCWMVDEMYVPMTTENKLNEADSHQRHCALPDSPSSTLEGFVKTKKRHGINAMLCAFSLSR